MPDRTNYKGIDPKKAKKVPHKYDKSTCCEAPLNPTTDGDSLIQLCTECGKQQ